MMAVLCEAAAAACAQQRPQMANLPDAPDVVQRVQEQAAGKGAGSTSAPVPAQPPGEKGSPAGTGAAQGVVLPPCPASTSHGIFSLHQTVAVGEKEKPATGAPGPVSPGAAEATGAAPVAGAPAAANCVTRENPYMRFLNSPSIDPLTPKQKGYLAVRDVADPFNLMTILGNSAIYIGSDAHTAYGPGLRGFGRNVGYSLLQDASGEFLGTFLICSLTGEDPHYHRDPHAPVMRRVGHAIVHTVVGRSDYGKAMPNYEALLGYPAGAVLSNLYVPGVATNLPSTMQRIGLGLATDPIGNLITEFLPDVAKHVHIRVVFVQRILNGIATGDQL